MGKNIPLCHTQGYNHIHYPPVAHTGVNSSCPDVQLAWGWSQKPLSRKLSIKEGGWYPSASFQPPPPPTPHSAEFARYYQAQGFTIGQLSETAQEAINTPTKKDVAMFSFRGSHTTQNLGCFKRNWALNDPFTLEFAEKSKKKRKPANAKINQF